MPLVFAKGGVVVQDSIFAHGLSPSSLSQLEDDRQFSRRVSASTTDFENDFASGVFVVDAHQILNLHLCKCGLTAPPIDLGWLSTHGHTEPASRVVAHLRLRLSSVPAKEGRVLLA